MTYAADLTQYGVIGQSIVRDTYHSFFTDSSNTSDNKIGQTYYDTMETGAQCKAYFSDAGFDNIIADGRTWYRDNYVVVNGGAIPGWWAFTQGLLSDYLAGGAEAGTSKSALNMIATSAAYAISTTANDQELQDFFWSRECAYIMLAYINNYRAGNALNPRVVNLKNWSMGHINQWMGVSPVYLSGHLLYYRPFMHWLTVWSLIEYYTHVSADADILQIIIDSIDWQWTNYWRSGDTYGSFNYTSVDTSTFPSGTWFNSARNDYEPYPGYNTGGTESSNDLNLMGVGIYGWLWTKTFDSKWLTRGDEIWAGGVSYYDAFNNWQHGAFLGAVTSTGVKGKSINQCYKWSTAYPVYREVAAPRSGGGTGSGTFSQRYSVGDAENAHLILDGNAVDDLLIPYAQAQHTTLISTSSASSVVMTGTEITVTVAQGEVVMIDAAVSVSHSLANNEVQIAIARNGAAQFNGVGGNSFRGDANGLDFCLRTSAIDNPPPGTYTYSLVWNAFAGTVYSGRQQIVATVWQNS